MPIGPKIVDHLDERHVKEIVNKIDTELSDPEVVSRGRYGPVNGFYYWSFAGRGEMSLGDKQKIKELYTDAGWFKVEAINSSDNQERPGLWSVKLYKAAQ